MRNKRVLPFLILLEILPIYTFWMSFENSSFNKEAIVQYRYTDFLSKNEQAPLCNEQYFYGKNSLKFLEEHDFNVKSVLHWGIVLISSENNDFSSLYESLQQDPNIEKIEPNYINQEASYQTNLGWVSTNDVFWNEQWGLTYISWPEAFSKYQQLLKNGRSPIVWVVDAWVNYNHVDLKDAMRNSSSCIIDGERSFCNHWYDFFSKRSTPLPVWDNHWTHIAGIIAASIDNWKGIIGVNPYAKIASLKVTNDYLSISHDFDNYSLLAALDFAIENWISIINASYWGSEYSEIMEEKIREYWEHWGLFITTAMNDGIDIDAGYKFSYPCWYELDNILCVTAIWENGRRLSTANVGKKSVDIAAPWEHILSTVTSELESYPYFENFSSCSDISSHWWSRGYCHDESYRFKQWVYSPTISFSKKATDSILRFDASCESSATDFKITFYSSAGAESTKEVNGVSWTKNEFKVTIPSYLSSFSFTIEKEGNEVCSIDDVWVYDVAYTDLESDAYDFWNWTSMATPFVAWLASLLKTLDPSLGPIEIKNLILENGDDNYSLQGITASWKTINAKKTLDALKISKDFGSNTVSNWWYTFWEQGEVLYNGYTREENNAFNFAKEFWLSSETLIENANFNGELTRIAMAKMISQFAINIIGLVPDESKQIVYHDVSESLNAKYGYWPLLVYQLWIMGTNIQNFRPYDYVTRAEFASVISRLVYKIQDWNSVYYEPHLRKLQEEGILSNTNPYRYEKRGLAILMLMRIAIKNGYITPL